MHDEAHEGHGRPVEELSVDVLGPVRARVGDQEIPLGPARQRAVFAALAMRANRIVSRRELIEAVWGDSPPASAQGSVYTYICGLRRSLEPRRSRWAPGDVLSSDRVGYQLRLSPGALDAERFDALRQSAHDRLAKNDPARAVRDLETALGLWRGDALSGVPGPFAEAMRARLGELRLVTTESWASAMLAAGGRADLASELAELVRAYPLRESLRAALMVSLYWSGRHVEALEVFREARRALVEELGIEPGPALRKLHEQILAGDPALDPPNPAETKSAPVRAHPEPKQAVPSAPRSNRRFEQARAPELRQLRALVDNLYTGHGGSVWIEGDKGTGKSELLSTALAEIGGNGVQVAWAVADEFSRRSPLRVMLECLGVTADSLLSNAAGIGWRHPGGGPAPRTWSGGDPVVVGVNQLLAIVAERCARGPMVLVVDDLQWADEATILLWHRLSVATLQEPLLLIASSRPAIGRKDVTRLRMGIQRRGGDLIDLAPLPGMAHPGTDVNMAC